MVCCLLQAVSDIRGLEKILEVSSAPALRGCFYCWLLGFTTCNKTVYCGHHTFLPSDHPLRKLGASTMAKRVAALEETRRSGAAGVEAQPHNSSLVPAPRTARQLRQGEEGTS